MKALARRRLLAAVVLSAGLLLACSSEPAGPSESRANADAEAGEEAFVTVAVDNHFHDIHPTDNRRIRRDQTFVVRNEGRNLHNFTIVGTEISEDMRPGGTLRWSPIGEVLEPGSYTVSCKYHDWDGMTGAFTVVP